MAFFICDACIVLLGMMNNRKEVSHWLRFVTCNSNNVNWMMEVGQWLWCVGAINLINAVDG